MQRLKNNIGWAFAGAAAVMIILAVSLPFHLIFKTEFVPAQITDAIIERTPPDNAIALQNALGALSFPFALMGGIMFAGMFGFAGGLVYNALRRFDAQEVAAIWLSGISVALLTWVLFPQHVTINSLAIFIATGFAIRWLTRRRLAEKPAPSITKRAPTDTPESPFTRREFLRNAALFSFGGLILSTIQGLPVFIAALNAAKPGIKLFAWAAPAARKPEFPTPGAPPEVTSVADFYTMRKFPNVVPPAPPDFQLVIDGLVDKPYRIGLDELFALPRTDVYITRQCVSNPVGGALISTALFSGVPLRTLIERAGVQTGAVEFKFYGRDGYEESIPIAYALEHGLVAYAMNGETLPEKHGPPLKMEVPGLYGFKNMKWLSRIEAINTPFQSVWAREGWSRTAIYKTMSRIDAVTINPNGGAIISGVGFSGIRGISGVEVQVNGGAWQTATLHIPPLSGETWVQWRLDVPDRGELNVACRAVDGTGTPQIETKQQQFPDGATGYHMLTVKV